jgi:hypothetical protein
MTQTLRVLQSTASKGGKNQAARNSLAQSHTCQPCF